VAEALMLCGKQVVVEHQEFRVLLIPGTAHAASILTDPNAYREYVANFLAEQFPGR